MSNQLAEALRNLMQLAINGESVLFTVEYDRAREALAAHEAAKERTGWPADGRMAQDDSRELSKWLSNTPGARRLVDEAAKPAEPVAWRYKYKFHDIGETGAYEYHSHDFACVARLPKGEPLYAAPVAVASPWMPIESAPKDGFVLVAGLSGYRGTPLRIAACEWSEDYGAWMTHSHGRFTDGGNDAAWWMPLPPAPEMKP